MNTIQTPAQLVVGNPTQIEQLTITRLQKQFCSNNGCLHCPTCKQIQAKQYHKLLWLCPEKQYTLETLELLFETIAFANNCGEHFFFVLEKAELLTTACANRLLKAVEEPPAGYHFIFLTHRLQNIIPTICSRCMIIKHESISQFAPNPLLNFFTQHTPDSLSFLQTLENQIPTESESVEFVDQLLNHWYLHAMKNPDQTTERQITLLQDALKQPPMTGGSKLFWRNLFIQWYNN